MQQLTPYVPQERTEGDSFKPSENLGHLLIVKVTDRKFIESTVHKPEGGPAVIVDVCDLQQNGAVFRDVLWMNGAVVDALKGYVGQTLCIRLALAKSTKSGREYITVEPAGAREIDMAQEHLAKGDPFAATVSTTAAVTAGGSIGGSPFGSAAPAASPLPPF